MVHVGHVHAYDWRAHHIERDCKQRKEEFDPASCHLGALDDALSLRGENHKCKSKV
jgi:hypothetical protein